MVRLLWSWSEQAKLCELTLSMQHLAVWSTPMAPDDAPPCTDTHTH